MALTQTVLILWLVSESSSSKLLPGSNAGHTFQPALLLLIHSPAPIWPHFSVSLVTSYSTKPLYLPSPRDSERHKPPPNYQAETSMRSRETPDIHMMGPEDGGRLDEDRIEGHVNSV